MDKRETKAALKAENNLMRKTLKWIATYHASAAGLMARAVINKLKT